MPVSHSRTLIAAASISIAVTSTALAMHRQSPPATRLSTFAGENNFPRLPPAGPGLVWSEGPAGSQTVVRVQKGNLSVILPLSSTPGNNTNPSATRTAGLTVWENDSGNGIPALYSYKQGVQQLALPFSASNPALSGLGNRLFFESTDDLDPTNPNPTQARQVFQRFRNGSITQISRGFGTSRNAAAGKSSGFVVFESTSDPADGHDTGIAQVWIGNAAALPVFATRITNGAAPSELPQVSDDGEIVAFQTRSALASDGHATSANQVFIYHAPSQTFAQITNDPVGCDHPVAYRLGTDYRIPYTCSGVPFYYDLRLDQRYRVPTPAGSHTERLVAGVGFWFLHLSTTGNLITNGLHPSHQLYLINLYKRPAVPVAGTATWFPFRGL